MWEECIKDYGLRPLWDELLAIFDEFARICKKHGLRYYALWGTVLGAVRHNGFIPWDDDFDVAMPREDYEKFLRIAHEELPSHYKIINWKNTSEFHYLFAKIQDTRRDRVSSLEKDLGFMMSNGIYIDVFPIDGYTTNKYEKIAIQLRDFLLVLIGRYRIYKWGDLTWRGRAARIVGMLLSIFVPRLNSQEAIYPIFEKTAKKFKFDASEFVGDVGLWEDVFHMPRQSRKSWGNPTPHPFEDRTIMLQENPDEYLKSRYGDNYMKPPPEKDRHPSHSYPYRCAWCFGPTTDKLPY